MNVTASGIDRIRDREHLRHEDAHLETVAAGKPESREAYPGSADDETEEDRRDGDDDAVRTEGRRRRIDEEAHVSVEKRVGSSGLGNS